MKALFDRLTQRIPRIGGVANSLSILISSTVASQLVLLISSIFVARLFTPDEVGQLAVVIGFATIVSVLLGGTYTRAIPIAPNNEEARELAWLGLLFAILGGALLFVGLTVSIALGYGDELGFGSTLAFLTVAAGLSLSLWSVLRALLLRRNEVGTAGAATVTGNATQGVVQVAAGLANLGGASLAVGYTIGRLSSSARMLRKAQLGRLPKVSALRGTEARWRRRVGILFVPASLTLLTVNATAPIIALLFGAGFAGFWSYALQFSMVPGVLLGQSVSSLFAPETARRLREGKPVDELVWGLLLGLLLGGLPVFALLALLGPELFAFILGERWREAGVLAAILAPWLALNLSSGPIAQTATVLERYRFLLVLAIFDATLRIGALLLGGALGDGLLAVALYAFSASLTALVWIVWVPIQVGIDRTRVWRLVVGILVLLFIVGLVAASRLVLPTEAYFGVSVVLIGLLGIASLRWLLRNLKPRLQSAREEAPQ